MAALAGHGNFGIVTDWYTSPKIKDLEDKVYLGDRLEFDRGMYKHWGIYVGRYQDMKHAVVHFGIFEGRAAISTTKAISTAKEISRSKAIVASSVSKKAEIRADTIWEIVGGCGKVRINNSIDKAKKPSDPFSICEMAKKMHQEQTQVNDKFSENDFEHLVNACRCCDFYAEQASSVVWHMLGYVVQAVLGWFLRLVLPFDYGFTAAAIIEHQTESGEIYTATESISSDMASHTTPEVKSAEKMVSGKDLLTGLERSSAREFTAEMEEEYKSQALGKASTANGSTSSLLASQTTPKTLWDRGRKMPRSQEPIPLKLVLDEVNELTENLHESERLDWGLQLPYIAVGYFNEKGGSLSLKEYGVHLTIPRGAIAPGSPQQVYIYVDPTAPPNDAVEPTEFALSQSVKCGPKGLRFEESVVLSFPYQADLKGHRYDKLVIRMRHGDSQERQWEDGNPALVTEEKAFVLVDHFCDFSLIGTPTPGSSKRLKVGAFGGVLNTRSLRYAFRIHVWNDDKNIEEIVIQEEEHMKSEKLDVFRNLQFFWNCGNLAVSVADLEGGWSIQGATEQIIDKGKIRVLNDNSESVTFILKRQTDDSKDKGLYCVVRTYQGSPTDDSRSQAEVHLKIFRNPENCSGGCHQMRGGAAASLASLKEQIGKGVSIKVHGEVEPQNFGGLSEKAVWSLCYHLDCERDGANNWRQLMQRMTDLPGRSVAVVDASGKIRTKGLLQLHFDICRDNNRTDNEAVEFLLGLLSEMKLDEAVAIIQDDLNKRDCDKRDWY